MNNQYSRILAMLFFLMTLSFPIMAKDLSVPKEKFSLFKSSGGSIRIAYDIDSPQQTFGVERLRMALKQNDLSPILIDRTKARDKVEINVILTKDGINEGILKEGFSIFNTKNGLEIRAVDEAGAMYGIMDLAEQIQMNKGLGNITNKLQNPRFPFRAIKYNLPWSSYRTFSALQVNEPLSKDLKMWESFLDMMAENRFNSLTLWNLHPFPYLIKAKNFPLATPFSDQELVEWKAFWTTLFKMAKDRGIDTYLINWNMFVSHNFKENYDSAGVSDTDRFLGDAVDTKMIRQYTRESITQVINEYPDLTGLGVTLGERMENMDSQQQTDWVEDVFFKGIKEANRPVKFIYRAALKGDHAVHRATIDASGLQEPIWVELKFNWSHGHATPTLVKAHGGGTGEEYWTNPAPSHHKMCWMMRNEDFFRLRWGEPDFIRAHIAQNGQDFVGGYFIGSETMIPAFDMFHKPNHEHVSWKYSFERQWLFYKEWGRLIYNSETTDAVFANAFNNKYEGNNGKEMIQAIKLSTRTNQQILSFFRVAQDATNYAEGFLGLRKFLTVEDVINSVPTEPNFVSVKEFGDGSRDFEGKITPLELATALETDVAKAMNFIKNISTTNNTLKCEIEDVKAWSYLGLYFAKKLRTAVAINQGKKTEAIAFITQAQQCWTDLVKCTEAHIIPGFVYGGGTNWHWSAYQDEVAADIDWVKAQ